MKALWPCTHETAPCEDEIATSAIAVPASAERRQRSVWGAEQGGHLLLRHRYPHQARVRPRYFPGITSMRCSI